MYLIRVIELYYVLIWVLILKVVWIIIKVEFVKKKIDVKVNILRIFLNGKWKVD